MQHGMGTLMKGLSVTVVAMMCASLSLTMRSDDRLRRLAEHSALPQVPVSRSPSRRMFHRRSPRRSHLPRCQGWHNHLPKVGRQNALIAAAGGGRCPLLRNTRPCWLVSDPLAQVAPTRSGLPAFSGGLPRSPLLHPSIRPSWNNMRSKARVNDRSAHRGCLRSISMTIASDPIPCIEGLLRSSTPGFLPVTTRPFPANSFIDASGSA